MKVRVACSVLLAAASLACAQPDVLEKAWSEVRGVVDKAVPKAETTDPFAETAKQVVDQGLVRTAIQKLRVIETNAVARKEWPYAVKAVSERYRLEAALRGGNTDELIPELKRQTEAAPVPMRPFLELILAQQYWQYYQQNRCAISQRVRVAEDGEGNDLRAWSLSRFLREIERQFEHALSYEAVLKLVPVDAYGALLEKGAVPDTCRPTLFDFVANEMIRFYSFGEWGGIAWDDAPPLSADGPALDDVPGFSFVISDEAARRSHVLRALRLFQSLLAFHEKDKDPTAFADADLSRLQFCYSQVVGDAKGERYAAALDRLIHRFKQHEIASRASALRARLALDAGEPGLARLLAQQGASLHPQSLGAAACRNLIAAVEEPAVSFSAEQVWCEPWPEMEITYKNLTEVQFRAIPVSFAETLASSQECRDGGMRADMAEALLLRKPAKSWEVALPRAADYKERSYRVRVPDKLPPGLYAVFASVDGKFMKDGKPVAMGLFRVSRLALVLEMGDDNAMGGYVLTARDGEPVGGATVQVWKGDRNRRFQRERAFVTGPDGRFHFAGGSAGEYLFVAEKDGHVTHTWSAYSKTVQPERPDGSGTCIEFFTDRGIYRPGQSVQYKGVALSQDRRDGRCRAVEGKPFRVQFVDGNNVPIAEQEVTSNGYGSFSGRFTVPRDRGTGYMLIKAGKLGQVWIQVEEYKRPKFEVTIMPPESGAHLGAVLKLTGKAVSYAGVPVAGAKVAWRVERSCMRTFCGKGTAYSFGDADLARGVSTTDAEGSFSVTFSAKPDAQVPEADAPEYTFRVSADVTDNTGETQACTEEVRLGYAAWQATLDAEDWQTVQNPVSLRVSLTSYAGAGVAAAGMVKVFRVMQPAQVTRSRLREPWRCGEEAGQDDVTDPERWPDDQEVVSEPVKTGTNGAASVRCELRAGLYRARFETQDAAGKAVAAKRLLRVIDPGANKLTIREPEYFGAESWRVEPGGVFRAVWGSGYDKGSALIVVEQHGRELLRVRTEPGVTQRKIELPITEAMRGGVQVRTLFVRENRIYAKSGLIDVPWSNKRLGLRWEHFTSRLEPGKKTVWRAVIEGPTGNIGKAEVVAVLYDRSLDAFRPNAFWPKSFEGFFSDGDEGKAFLFANRLLRFEPVFGSWKTQLEEAGWTYRAWPQWMKGEGGDPGDPFSKDCFAAPACASAGYGEGALCAADPEAARTVGGLGSLSDASALPGRTKGGGQGLGGVKLRKDFQETAFFLPQLLSDESGKVAFEFTMPDSVSGWRFMAFAHDREMRSGFMEAEAVSVKELMVEANPPRFVREGDEVALAVKVSNRSDRPQKGRVRLGFCDAATLEDVNERLGNAQPEQVFALDGGASETFEWRIRVPSGQGFMTYKAQAASDDFTDGEEGSLPVLPRRVAVQESLPLSVRGRQLKAVTFPALTASGGSETIRHQSLSVQRVTRPAWYAVMALPYLMEFPHACCEQTFNRYYANALARHIAASDPKIRAVFDQWKGTGALDSPLEKNPELKAVMLAETPWLHEASDERAARRNVGLLFDEARTKEEGAAALKLLRDARLSDGAWPWFPGGARSDFITLYVVAGFGRLRHLGVAADVSLAVEAIPGLDAWLAEQYGKIVRDGKKTEGHLTPTVALYLYARSFFLKDVPVDAKCGEAVEYYLGQARQHWRNAPRQSQAHAALGLKRWGRAGEAGAILRALREAATVDEEQGMYWRDAEAAWSWFCAPVETQALMVEAFSEISGDVAAAEACKAWLLRQKQTQDWKTTTATADAVYAVLLQGASLLDADSSVDVSLAGKPVDFERSEAGTGFAEKRYGADQITPDMGKVTVIKQGAGVAWVALHWQYLDDLAALKASDGAPMSVRKQLFVKEHTAKGPVLSPAGGVLRQGSELVTRLEVRVDRDMEFVYLKDGRPSCVEPVDVLSCYRWLDGVGCYESTRDTATHFYFDSLPKGVYVFEYASRVQQKGLFRSGIAEVQCMYAPAFCGHSESTVLQVK